MPDFHQPDDEDRRRAEATGAVEGTTGDWAERVPLEELRSHAAAAGIADAASLSRQELVQTLRTVRPSNRNDPGEPDRPLT